MSDYPFEILTEVTCDLPDSYLEKNGVILIPMRYNIDGTEYVESNINPAELHPFYEKLRKGMTSKTVAVTPLEYETALEAPLKEGKDVLFLGFTSGLSSAHQNAVNVSQELAERYPDNRIICIDTLCTSGGQGLIVDYAVKKRNEGLSLEDTAKAVESIKTRVCHYFTVDDLNHLYRGGRVSRAQAIVGGMLGIKPLLLVDKNGKLSLYGKVRGRKASLDALVKRMGDKLSSDYQNPYVYIGHGDCEADAKYVAEQVKAKYGIKTEIISYISAIVGTHSGPGTVALFFIGSDREETPA